ncbi:MAG: hypothetical protein ACI870_000029 [Crocinitomicaceae bacterium]|jgi:hypothetical protein
METKDFSGGDFKDLENETSKTAEDIARELQNEIEALGTKNPNEDNSVE